MRYRSDEAGHPDPTCVRSRRWGPPSLRDYERHLGASKPRPQFFDLSYLPPASYNPLEFRIKHFASAAEQRSPYDSAA